MAHINGRPQPAVRNAADPRQIRLGEQIEKRRAERFDNAMAAVLNTPAGRTVFAQLIRRAGVYRSIWHPSAEIHYNAGRQDYGHELMADIIRTSEAGWQQLEREQWEWEKAQERTIAAGHTRRASEGDEKDGD